MVMEQKLKQLDQSSREELDAAFTVDHDRWSEAGLQNLARNGLMGSRSGAAELHGRRLLRLTGVSSIRAGFSVGFRKGCEVYLIGKGEGLWIPKLVAGSPTLPKASTVSQQTQLLRRMV